MLIGYARVSTTGQNFDRQISALRDAGCELIFREKLSGKSIKNRPELEKAIDRLGSTDVLVVAEWDRATRSMLDGIELMQRIAARGAAIKVLDKPHLDLTTPIGQGLLALLSAMAEDERQRIVKRAAEGRAAARARHVKFGRPSALSDHQQARELERLAAGDSLRAIAADKRRAQTGGLLLRYNCKTQPLLWTNIAPRFTLRGLRPKTRRARLFTSASDAHITPRMGAYPAHRRVQVEKSMT